MEWNLNNKFSKKNLFLSLDFEVLINHSMVEIHPFPKKNIFTILDLWHICHSVLLLSSSTTQQ